MESIGVGEKIASLAELGSYINEFDDRLRAHMHRALHANPWFTTDNQEHALKEIARHFLDSQQLKSWIEKYDLSGDTLLNVGVIAAGNIPLVGFHDVLSVFISGNVAQIKVSERDPYLLPFLLKRLEEINPDTKDYFNVTERLSDFDAIIATGSNNSARYFEEYFGKYPNIIRKNRNGVAVLTGEESLDELHALGEDIFRYFGLGCRNVSHVFVPEDYNFDVMKEVLAAHSHTLHHSKYRNNFDHNLAIYILNRFPYLDLDGVLLIENNQIISPIGCLFYTRYSEVNELEKELIFRQDEIQCVVSNIEFQEVPGVAFGEAQRPSLIDYADGVDTMKFLTSL